MPLHIQTVENDSPHQSCSQRLGATIRTVHSQNILVQSVYADGLRIYYLGVEIVLTGYGKRFDELDTTKSLVAIIWFCIANDSWGVFNPQEFLSSIDQDCLYQTCSRVETFHRVSLPC